mgnify:CR=1 FL=1
MSKTPFSYIALALSIPLLILLQFSAPENSAENTKLPLLTILIISEFGAIVTAIGAVTGFMRTRKTETNYSLLATSIACALFSFMSLIVFLFSV